MTNFNTLPDSTETPTLAHTIPDACRCMGISRTTIYELLKQREIRSFKIGRRTLIPDSDLRDFIAKRLEVA